ncbi:hypothetical protein RIF29_03755 [Crotalaria pallida]|uniref:DUF4283 domain-containing protein n=1 Tax=Crotalaria pallida TaxID=3830 RepID=A0AAN9J161_CROPI
MGEKEDAWLSNEGLLQSPRGSLLRNDDKGKDSSGIDGWSGLENRVKEDTVKRLSECYVGETKRLEDEKCMNDLLTREGFFSVKATPLGGKLVMIQGQRCGEVEDLMKEEEVWFKSVFADVRKWSPLDIVRERYVWLRCFGIPAQAWEEDFFSMIADRWGKLIELESKTKNIERMDIGSFLLETTLKRKIDDILKVKVGVVMVEIRVMEDPLEMMGWDQNVEENTSFSSEDMVERVSEKMGDEQTLAETKGWRGEHRTTIVNTCKKGKELTSMGGVTSGINIERGNMTKGVIGSRETVAVETAEAKKYGIFAIKNKRKILAQQVQRQKKQDESGDAQRKDKDKSREVDPSIDNSISDSNVHMIWVQYMMF